MEKSYSMGDMLKIGINNSFSWSPLCVNAQGTNTTSKFEVLRLVFISEILIDGVNPTWVYLLATQALSTLLSESKITSQLVNTRTTISEIFYFDKPIRESEKRIEKLIKDLE